MAPAPPLTCCCLYLPLPSADLTCSASLSSRHLLAFLLSASPHLLASFLHPSPADFPSSSNCHTSSLLPSLSPGGCRSSLTCWCPRFPSRSGSLPPQVLGICPLRLLASLSLYTHWFTLFLSLICCSPISYPSSFLPTSFPLPFPLLILSPFSFPAPSLSVPSPQYS